MNGAVLSIWGMEESILLNSVYDFDGVSAVPERLVLVPAGGSFSGIDGRSFNNSNPERIIARWKESGHDIPVDVEHSTERLGVKGHPAPAVGWVSDLQASSDGVITGAVSWTDEGRELISSRKYRYYSPAFLVSKDTGEVVGIRSIGLTNIPNLSVPSLNEEGGEEGEDMEKDNYKVICNSLGIGEGATEAEIVTEINSLKVKATEAEGRAAAAEQELAAIKEERFKAELNAALDSGISEGKIAPAQKDYFLASINSQKQLDDFKAMLGKSPKVLPDEETVKGKMDDKPETELNAEEEEACRIFGISAEDYRKAKEDK